jgi:hypothetical protein
MTENVVIELDGILSSPLDAARTALEQIKFLIDANARRGFWCKAASMTLLDILFRSIPDVQRFHVLRSPHPSQQESSPLNRPPRSALESQNLSSTIFKNDDPSKQKLGSSISIRVPR